MLAEPAIGRATWRQARHGAVLGFFMKLSPAARIAAVILLVYVAVALSGPLWAPYSFNAVLTGGPFEPPSTAHLLGTDNLGRDVLSRVVYGSRPVLAMALSATGLATLVGAALALQLVLQGGLADEIGMRILEILASVPPLVLALLLISGLGNGNVLIVLAVAFLFAPRIARVVRAAAMAVVVEDYVTAALTRGEAMWSIAVREMLPNVAGTILVEFAIRCGFAVVFIGALGFLGFGAAPPAPEWGLMINEGRANINASLWPVLAPAAAMAVLVVAINLFTEGLARAIGDAPGTAP
ncbi:MAG: ABC transporter permease [Methylobacteriaceae bacterium]|nr:ABC transporter permease [Methylobacteriaceae bacterium]